jgi:unsaturated rhamnogalacturonyl hydrolase
VLALIAPAACDDDDDDDDSGGGSELTAATMADANALARSFIAQWAPERNSWSWGDGVLMFGLTQLYDAEGDQAYYDYVKAYVDHYTKTGDYFYAKNDNCIPAKSALWLAAKTGDEGYMAPVAGFVNYLDNVAVRLSDGGINHLGWQSDLAIWMDSLFMLGPLLLDLYERTGDRRYADEIEHQIVVFARHLRASPWGLWKHRYSEPDDAVTPPDEVFWGRGNGWVLVAMADFLDRGPADATERENIEYYFTSLAAGIKRYQNADGLWTTVLNQPETSYTELSAGALFAKGFLTGVRLGLLDDSYREAAHQALAATNARIFVDDLGRTRLPSVSMGTGPGEAADYNEVITAENVNYGIGAYLLAAVELAREDGR